MTTHELMWHVLRVFVGSPLKIAAAIEERGFTAYCPSKLAKRVHPFNRRTLVEYKRPLFPGYLFVLTRQGGFHWSMIEDQRTRARFLTDGERCLVLDDDEIDDIREVEALENRPAWRCLPPPRRLAKAGETVKILHGILFGKEAVIERVRGQQAKIRLKSAADAASWFVRLDQVEPV